ncbi:MAG: enoyl-CoA hydratase-related protein [Planctomycetota bacterium]
MPYDNLLMALDGGVATVTINRPEKLNALNDATIAELTHAFTNLPEGARVAILTGAGEKAFVAGADIAELAELTAVAAKDVSARGQAMCDAIEQCAVPVIGAINGFALGGGLEVAMACNIRYASTKAKMGLPEVTLGIIPGYGGTQRLPRLVGEGRAMEMVTSGAMIDAEEAGRIGLVNRVCEPDELMEACGKLAGKIARNGPVAVRYAMEAVNRGMQAGRVEGMRVEEDLFGVVNATEDVKEGLNAFLEKRKAEFRGS